ncbi:MAG: TonB-dependent receptor [Alphaproteobacteria bacterium]|nr:TonB-dependent receptor [Alphaproteobacteria bacterium]
MAAATLAGPAFGQSATPGAAVTALPPVTVEAAAPSVPETIVRQRLEALPGGTALITREDLTGRANVTLSDSLRTVPGVIVQDFFGGNDQPRVQIRGSGLQQNPVERGILVLQDGLPLNRADGSYVVGLADPRQARFTEIYRGYVANRLGATVLGGAINFASPNGRTDPGVEGGIEGGSFGQRTATARAGGRADDMDGHVQASYSARDGFRDHNGSDRANFNLNSGIRHGENVGTRLFAGYTDLGFDVPGPLTWAKLKEDPTQVYGGPTVTLPGPAITSPGPNVRRDLPQREVQQFRAGSRTSATFGAQLLDVGVGFTSTDDSFRFPIASGYRVTDGADATVVLRYAYQPNEARPLPLLEATAKYDFGSADRENFQNIAGTKGARFGDSELDASTLSFNVGMHIPIDERVTLSPSIAYAHAVRENEDKFGTGLRPVAGFNPVTGAFQRLNARAQDTSYRHGYSGWSPSLGLAYEAWRDSIAFGAVSRSFEPPTHDDLLATVNGTPFFSPGAPVNGVPQFAFATPDLDAQTATTIEAGWRGRSGRFAWNASAYYSWIDDELLSLRDASGTQLASVNADKTRHLGIELGFGVQMTDELSGRLVYNYQDFRFDGDPVYGDNRLAGAPRHTINAAIRYTFWKGLFVETEVNWLPERTPVDNANTLFNKPWATVDFRASYDVVENFSVYGEMRNAFDQVYASSTLITDRAQPDQAAFLPGDGRAFILGLKARM